MKKFITTCLALLALFSLVISTTETAYAQNIMPRGVKLVLASKCDVNLGLSVPELPGGTGRAENMILSLYSLAIQLPEECSEDQCVFTNIDPDWFLFLIPKYLEKFENDLILLQISERVRASFQGCSIEANPRQSIYEASGSLSCGNDGNSLVLSINGSNDTFTSSQFGCSSANVQMIGTNLTVHIMQFGAGNVAIITVAGHDIVFTLNQYDGAVYIGTITTPGVHNVTQN